MTIKRQYNKLSLTLLAIIFLNIITIKVFAQYDHTLYYLHTVPQTTLYNPSTIPDYSYHFSFPFLSSIYSGMGSTGATYNDAFIPRNDDSLVVNVDGIINSLGNNNTIHSQEALQIFSIGARYDKLYLSASISEIVDINFDYSKDFASLLAYGNEASIGKTLDLGRTSMKAQHYREYALGAAYQINEALNIGVRGKLLFGKSAIDTETLEGSITTSEDNYYITTHTNVTINTSLPDSIDMMAKKSYYLSSNNMGMAFDFGASYKINKKISITASVLDLGWIKYDRYLKNFSNEDVTWTYKGIDAMQFDGLSEDDRTEKFNEIKDSLIDMFKLNETENEFKVQLTAKLYFGASYKISESGNIGLLARAEIYRKEWRPSFSLSYQHSIDEHLGLIASYTIADNSYTNFGVGIVVKLSSIQIYATTDNILGIVMPDLAHYTNIHFGINFIFPEKPAAKTMTDM